MPRKGFSQDPEHVAKRVAALRTAGVYEKGGKRIAELNRSRRGQPLSDATRQKIAIANKGKQNALGFKRSPEFKRKLADYWAANREKHNHYKDGKGGERAQARLAEMQRLDYRIWRNAVFNRDARTCQDCGTRDIPFLQAHHLKEWADYPELRYDIDNGLTLCRACHGLRHRLTYQDAPAVTLADL